jgi:hypothetical protein
MTRGFLHLQVIKFLFPVYYGAKYTSNKGPKHVFLEGVKYYNHAVVGETCGVKYLQEGASKHASNNNVILTKALVQGSKPSVFDVVARTASPCGAGAFKDASGLAFLHQRRAGTVAA